MGPRAILKTMHPRTRLVTAVRCAAAFAAMAAWAQSADLSGERIRAHVKFLSSDLLEGRGVGARGGDLATDYIAAQFALMGPSRPAITGHTSSACRWWASPREPTRLCQRWASNQASRSAGWTISSASPNCRSPTSSSTPKPSSSATASSRRNSTGTISRAWT